MNQGEYYEMHCILGLIAKDMSKVDLLAFLAYEGPCPSEISEDARVLGRRVAQAARRFQKELEVISSGKPIPRPKQADIDDRGA